MPRLTRSALGAAALLATLALPTTAVASDGDVRVKGSCTKSSTAKLKLSNEDGRIEVEFEVDQNRVGVRWAVLLRSNGVVFFQGQRRTKAPSGSFTVHRLVADASGTDTIRARATSPSGELCTARARI